MTRLHVEVRGGLAVHESGYRRALAELGYPYVDETDNPASRLFLDGA